jgi:hypothetical protein
MSNELPSGYSATTRLLARKVKPRKGEKPLIVRKSLDPNKPIFWHLPQNKAVNLHNWQHEKMCSDLYVSLETTGLLKHWFFEPNKEYLDIGLKPDRVCLYDGKIFFIEADNGTEVLSTIQEKGVKYKQLSNLHRDRRFWVVFITKGKRRLENILSVLPKDRGAMFQCILYTDLLDFREKTLVTGM